MYTPGGALTAVSGEERNGEVTIGEEEGEGDGDGEMMVMVRKMVMVMVMEMVMLLHHQDSFH